MSKPSLAGTRRILLGSACLLVGGAIWLPLLHLFYRPATAECITSRSLSGKAPALLRRHLALWQDPAARAREVARMRSANAEWDFMGRSFVAWSLAEAALRDPAIKPAALEVIDLILDETLRLEREKGQLFFLMPYGRERAFTLQPARSQFIDGEIALMLALRRLVEEKSDYRPLLAERIELMAKRMELSPVLSAESYPDECWTFCNSVALAAMRVADYLDGTDHSGLIQRWVQTAREKLVDPGTGLLVSAYTPFGRTIYGPEGSSIWMVAHCLRLVDEPFARDQYQRARRELGRGVLGFGYSREWPASAEGPSDIDSGAVVPGLGLSIGASGMAFIAASSFDDEEFLRSLWTTVDLAGFPGRKDGQVRYYASNQVGEAVLLYSTVLGAAWEKVHLGGWP